MPFALSWRMLRRDARSGELRLLAAALVVAVAALTAVGFLADRVRQALQREAQQMLGADLLLIADHPWPSALQAEAQGLGLQTVETRTFPSMVLHGRGDTPLAQLVEIKAVGEGYPLRGSLRIARAAQGDDRAADGVPPPGSIWIDERLASALDARVGSVIAVGESALRVDALLTLEPDRGVNFFSVAPRLMMNLGDLQATRLVQSGSRVGYRLLLSGDATSIQSFRDAMASRLQRGERIEDLENARPEIRSAMERAQRFLGLSALLTVVLAAVAVALAARRYVQRHLDPCAVMRCLGATQTYLLRLYLGQFLLLGLVSTLLGCAVGYLAHFVLHAWLSEILAITLPAPGGLPVAQGFVVGFLLLLGFVMPPLWQLKRVSTLRVLRREFAGADGAFSRLLLGYLAGLLALAAMMFWVAGEPRLGVVVVGGFVGALLLFALVARLMVRLAAGLRGGLGQRTGGGGIGWRYGLASLERRAAASVVQIVALALGFMALLLLTVTRGELLDAWRRASPPDAANRFVLNIQPQQLADVRKLFSDDGLQPEFSPMVRGRLVRLNGADVVSANYADERARRLIDREFNLSYRTQLPPGNSLTAGRWFSSAEQGTPAGVASVEDGLARTLGLKVGDRIEFSLAGEIVAMTIVGLRKLDWDSMRVNFFVLTPPALLDRYPASWITSFHLPAQKQDFVARLVREFPNLTVIDVSAIVRQLQAILDQVAQAVQFVFLFTLLAGVIVLYAALASAADERRYELAVMRALGARRIQLRAALLTEFAAVGGLAGLIAALAALAVGQFLARQVFLFELRVDWLLLPAATAGGALLVTVAGWQAAAGLLRVGPLEALRAGN